MDLPRDEGCQLFPSCLHCPLPCCIEDIPRGKQRQIKEIRNLAISRLFYDEGKSVKEIAQKFGVSQRTVQRALKRC